MQFKDDTVVFPRRLMKFLRTLDAITPAETVPLYFGTVKHLHKYTVLCSEMGLINGTVPSYAKNGKLEGTPICYAQGGAGYGLNNVAMRIFANTTLCTVSTCSEMV